MYRLPFKARIMFFFFTNTVLQLINCFVATEPTRFEIRNKFFKWNLLSGWPIIKITLLKGSLYCPLSHLLERYHSAYPLGRKHQMSDRGPLWPSFSYAASMHSNTGLLLAIPLTHFFAWWDGVKWILRLSRNRIFFLLFWKLPIPKVNVTSVLQSNNELSCSKK